MNIKLSKIVGVANEKSWSQVHDFKPEDRRQETHGQLMAALSFKAKKEEINISSFGTEIITRLQEMYYSNESKSIFKKVSQVMESLGGEFFNEVELEIVMMVVWKDILYAGKTEKGQVYLWRDGVLVKLLNGEGNEVVSGRIVGGDKLIGGTGEFFKITDNEQVKTVLEEEEITGIMESLATIIHGEEKNSQAAGVIVGVDEEEKVEEAIAGDEKKGEIKEEMDEEIGEERKEMKEKWSKRGSKGKKLIGTVKEQFGLAIGRVKGLLSKGRSGRVFIRGGGVKRQKSAATVALVLVVVFGLSLVLAGRKRARSKKQAEYQAVVEEVKYKYDEAVGLIELNPLRAKSLLKDSQERIELYKIESEEKLSDELEELVVKIEEVLGQVQKEYELESATEWFDFSLVKDGFKASDWELEDEEVLVWDKDSKIVVLLNLETKASRVVIGGDEIEKGKLVGLAGERGMVVSGSQVSVVDTGDDEVVAEIGADEWEKIVDAVGFGGNLYLLDSNEEGQIWKYLGVSSGLSSKRSYLKADSLDLSEAVSMAIDASVWVLFSDGTIVKYTRGVKDAFVVSGLDQAFEEPKKIFTSPEVEYLYVLDQKKTRVVVIDKAGEYKAQYVWQGIAGVDDLVVSEELGKIFLLTGEKVFVIELK